MKLPIAKALHPAPTAEQRKKIAMDDARPAAGSAGPQLSRRALLQGGAALGLAAASLTGPFGTTVRASAGQGPGGDDWGAFDRAIQTAARTFGIVGAAVAVVNTAGLVHQRTFGVRDLATGAPVAPRILFRVASTTKSMSALLVANSWTRGCSVGISRCGRSGRPSAPRPTS